MVDVDEPKKLEQLSPGSDTALVRQMKQAIASGEHWYLVLLEAIGKWTIAEEVYHGRRYCYLVAGEAFDWLLLAERLCEAVDGLLPEDEKMALLFYGKSPLQLSVEEFKKLIGNSKYCQYLNYFYGVTVERALVLAVQDEVRKERWALGYTQEGDVYHEVYRRIYGKTNGVLLKNFRKERGYPRLKSINLAELKEFTYWLFKYRLKQCDKARVASDTKKALLKLSLAQLAGETSDKLLVSLT
jgi:hypothetical protein